MNAQDLLIERLAIEDVFARYAHTADGYDAKGFVACFAEDGIFEFESEGNRLQFIGQQALHDFIRAHIRLLPNTRHVMTNHLVDIEGDHAEHRCTLTGTLSRPDKVYTFISGWYESTLEKVAGQWKIKHRIAHADNVASFTEGELVDHIRPLMEWMAENGNVA